jgi:hypothetical protein
MDRGSGDKDARELWTLYGRHASLLLARGPNPDSRLEASYFIAFSGAEHVDLNQAALFGDAGLAEARAVVELAVCAGVPTLLGRSSSVRDDVTAPLAEGGFRRHATPDALFWMPGAPSATDGPFTIRQVRTSDDVAAMEAMFLDVHGYEPALTGRLYGEAAIEGGPVTGWLAWDGPEPVSFTLVTHTGRSLGLWEVMTPLRHRRRGAARAVVSGALAASSDASPEGIDRTLFWASPAGRPLYEALGFMVADVIEAWTLGASEADLAAVGAG